MITIVLYQGFRVKKKRGVVAFASPFFYIANKKKRECFTQYKLNRIPHAVKTTL